MDEATVLDYLIKHLKQMQDKVKFLEEEQARKQRRMESFVLIKKSHQPFVEDEGSSDDVGSSNDQEIQDAPLIPEIEAKVCDKTILLKIHCEKSKGLLVNLIAEVESLNLAVSSTSVTSFGSLALEITIVAEMEEEFNLSMKEVVKALQSAVQLPPQQAD